MSCLKTLQHEYEPYGNSEENNRGADENDVLQVVCAPIIRVSPDVTGCIRDKQPVHLQQQTSE
ncbi:hypothetical protein [Nitrosomonas sp.]|uniref:hypothetical protein n=1 Tax=Nitrosomonas sp. TaxID=42353 RepID=UPI0025F56639|nr:hypothetical protein [Nitrosomonas sp.]MCC6916070.1 hypothetical protein [Nitrosomonas sp.]